MYKNYLIIASKKDKAGMNIVNALKQYNLDIKLVEEDILHKENLDLIQIDKYDFIIFASKHSSESKEKTLSIHPPGNWIKADFGGEQKKVCKSSALFQKQFFEKLSENVKKHKLKDYKVTLECTHHGPLINKPCLFAEIGSTETEYNDRRAAFLMAKTIAETIESFKENPYNEIAIGIGGPHYCPNFNKIQKNSNIAISHVIPNYCLPLTEEILKQAITKTEEEVDFAVIDWKGIGNKQQRDEMLALLDKMYIQYKRTSEISK